MNKSDTISTLAAALAKAQQDIGAAVKGASNPFFKSNYADLGSVMSVCKGPLLAQGVSVLQLVGKDESGGYLETILLHESGEFISDRMQLVCAKQHDPQAMGSAITYARRYALQSALFIPAEDDDGENAMRPTREIQSADESAERRQDRREQAERGSERGLENPYARDDWRAVVVHFGKNKDKALGSLPSKTLKWYQEEWHPKPYNGSMSPQDVTLRAALDASMKDETPPPRQVDSDGDAIPF